MTRAFAVLAVWRRESRKPLYGTCVPVLSRTQAREHKREQTGRILGYSVCRHTVAGSFKQTRAVRPASSRSSQYGHKRGRRVPRQRPTHTSSALPSFLLLPSPPSSLPILISLAPVSLPLDRELITSTVRAGGHCDDVYENENSGSRMVRPHAISFVSRLSSVRALERRELITSTVRAGGRPSCSDDVLFF